MMKFIKEFVYEGKYRQITGYVAAELGYRTKIIRGTHSVTHDDYEKDVPLHRVIVMVDGHTIYSRDEIFHEEEVYNIAKEWISELMMDRMRAAADKPEKVKAIQRLKELFEQDDK